MPKRNLTITDEDIEYTQCRWYGPDSIFIEQKEKNTDAKHLVMFDICEARQLRDVLNEFLS